MPTPDLQIPPRLRRRLEHWLERWGTPSLNDRLRVEFSPRLRRAFGRCYQDERLIRLTPSLVGSQSHLLAEILCHEAAHAAVYERHGRTAKPHGEEWENLMRLAGFEPRVRIPVVVRSQTRTTTDRVVYLHRCPVCSLSRRAGRPMHRWRCRSCATTRSQGRLEILRQAGATRTRRREGSPTPPAQRRRAVAGVGDAIQSPARPRRARSRAR